MLSSIDIIDHLQAIASEVNLKRLFAKLLAIAIENADATRSILMLLKENQLHIEAIGEPGVDAVHVLESVSVTSSNSLPAAVIQEIVKIQSDFLHRDNRHRDQPSIASYAMQHQSLSTLCIPIFNNENLLGILYLENNQIADAFTSNHLKVLMILCSQAAISIKNALDYQALEQELEGHREQLAQANLDLQASEAERRYCEAKLQAQQVLLQQIIDAVPSSILVNDRSGRFLALNQTAAALYGTTVEEILGRNSRDLSSIHEVIKGHLDNCQEVMATRQTKIISQQSIETNSGNLRWYQATIHPILNSENQVEGTISFATDVTYRKQAETLQQEQLHLLQVILDALPFPIFYKDDRGIYLGCNRAFLDFRGMSEAQIVGKSVYETAPAPLAKIYAEADQALFASRSIQTYETAVAYADGSQHEVIFYKAAFLNRQGDLGGLVGAILDITDRKQAEAALQASLEQLALANQEIKLLNQRLESENLRLSAELAVARQLQQIILPKEQEFSQIEDLEIAAFMEPADEVGGDYYDILRYHDTVKIGIGDVTGHGLESGILMIMVQTAVRTLLTSNETNPQRFLNTINQVLYDNIQRMGSNKNLSLALLDYQSGCVKLSGQHEEMLVVRSNGQIEQIDTVDLGFPLGIVPDIRDFVTQIEVQLQPGDGVVLYTDGITEAENLTKEYYGLARLCQVVSQHWQHSAKAIQQAIVEDVRSYIGTQKIYDDITLLVLKQH